jgi:hypothetical protein
MTPNWRDGIVGQITNHAATPNQAPHLTGGACSVLVTCSSLVPRRQVSFVVRRRSRILNMFGNPACIK